MNFVRCARVAVAVAMMLGGVGIARADYWSNPELLPANRCGDIPSGIGCVVEPTCLPDPAVPGNPNGTDDTLCEYDTTQSQNLKPNPAYDPSDPNKCIPSSVDPGGELSLHCQKLFWDLPSATSEGMVAVAGPYYEDRVPRFPRGVTDRVPPMYRGLVNGELDGFERLQDCSDNADAGSCEALCQPNEIPYWAEKIDPATGKQEIGTSTDFGVLRDPNDPTKPQTGPLMEVRCQRGVRSYYGPWQTAAAVKDYSACTNNPESKHDAIASGCSNTVFDRLIPNQPIRFDNTELLAADQARVEWNTGSEFYNHFSSHHGTCSAVDKSGTFRRRDENGNDLYKRDPGTGDYLTDGNGSKVPVDSFSPACADPDQALGPEHYQSPGDWPGGWAAYVDGAEYGTNDPFPLCWEYQRGSHPGSNCDPADSDPRCGGDRPSMGGFRNATQIPGRLSVPLPDNRGIETTEDTMWGCNHHVVTQLPPGSYGMSGLTARVANYRLQRRGLTNTEPQYYLCPDPMDSQKTVKTLSDGPDCTRSTENDIWLVKPGEEFGGAVGEMVIQHFSKGAADLVKPLNVMFNAAADAATTYYPPFTWNYHESEWTPPFDAQVALMAIHSHHRMVKGTGNITPANPPRPNASDPNCGGPRSDGLPPDLYTDWEWEDAPVCQYWKEPDGPVALRKGQALRTTCFVNNGVTPEAIKHGLVAEGAVRFLKETYNAPIPDYPEAMGAAQGSPDSCETAATWGDALRCSPVGKELLYGTHPPINYRVNYKCSKIARQVPGATLVNVPFATSTFNQICNPNPATDDSGDYIDGPYVNEEQCGDDGLCQPGSIVFACVGEEEMCIGVSMYWAMPRLLSDSNDEAVAELTSGNVDNVGTPGNLGVATDVSGICTECEPGL